MARKSNKKYQLVISGLSYERNDLEKVSFVTKEELEILRPLFEDIKLQKGSLSWNWSSSDYFYIDVYGNYDDHLVVNNAFRDLYPQYYHDFKLQKLVMNTFPNRGYVDDISKITINEIKELEVFEF